MTVLNAKYALKRGPTDVLSFRRDDASPRERMVRKTQSCNHVEQELAALKNAPYLDIEMNTIVMPSTKNGVLDSDIPLIVPDLGNIFLSVGYCNHIARERGMRLHDYVLLGTVHGLAHLVGHTHNDRRSYQTMKQAEREVLTVLRERFPSMNCDPSNGIDDNERSSQLPQSYLP